jgi:hypothetical protein
MCSTRIEEARPTVPISKGLDYICVIYNRSNIVAESGLPLGCAHIGGKSTYAISCVSPTAACPTPPPSDAYALYLRGRGINIHIAALCARYSSRLANTAIVKKTAVPHGCGAAGALTPSTKVWHGLNSPHVVVGAIHLGRQSIA